MALRNTSSDHDNHSYLSSIMSESPSVRASTSKYSRKILPPRSNDGTFCRSLDFNPSDLSVASVASTSLTSSVFNRSHPFNSTVDSLVNRSDMTIIEEESHEAATGSTLFQQFYDGLSRYHNPEDTFDMVKEFEDICNDHLDIFDSMKKKRNRKTEHSGRIEKMVKLERNTWRLARIIYEDRLKTLNLDADMVIDGNPIMSDSHVIDTFYQKNGDIRQMQLVIDWLEQNASDDLEKIEKEDKIQFYSEGPHYWENTLHQLTTKKVGSKKELCPEMDPDASNRTTKDIQELDREDEGRVMRYVFKYLRAGKLFVGKELAQKLGYHWLAACLEGWTLHQDENIGAPTPGRVEGNSQRDLWKYTCWASSSMGIPMYERALFGALSGNVAAVLPVCGSWQDKLWAYFRSSIDCQIEMQLRLTNIEKPVTSRTRDITSFTKRESVDLPAEYWSNNRSPFEIFREVEALIDRSWFCEEKLYFHVQKAIIINDIDGAFSVISELIKSQSERTDPAFSQLLRFSAHLVLFLRNIGLIQTEMQKQLYVLILDSYIGYLIECRALPIIASYVSKLPEDLQTISYSRFLKVITDKTERKKALALARDMNMNVEEITKMVVDHLRHDIQAQNMVNASAVLDVTLSGLVSVPTQELDKILIGALDWLSIGAVQYIEALKQGNCLMRSFVSMGKIDAAKEVYRKIPADVIDGVMRIWKRKTNSNELSQELKNFTREYLCFSAFFHAIESFNDWVRFFNDSKPREPQKPTSSRFMDKVAYDHAKRSYEADIEQWKLGLAAQAKLTTDKMFNVLLFPDGGWMNDSETIASRREEDLSRYREMSLLRKQLIPQFTFILHTVLQTSGNYPECIQLADVIANEYRKLYSEFTVDQLSDLMKKIRESSLAALSDNRDSLGYELS